MTQFIVIYRSININICISIKISNSQGSQDYSKIYVSLFEDEALVIDSLNEQLQAYFHQFHRILKLAVFKIDNRQCVHE